MVKNYHLCNNTIVQETKSIYTGSFSSTCLVVLKDFGRCVTVKKCHADYSEMDCLWEAKMLMKCDHPNIVQYVGSSVHGHPMYIILELMLGGNLLKYLHENESTITSTQLIAFCTQAANGMAFLTSKGFVHRNLSAESCLIDNFTSNNILKISDFQLAKETKSGKFISNKEECKHIKVKWTAPEVRMYDII